jgi:hypothetical protein
LGVIVRCVLQQVHPLLSDRVYYVAYLLVVGEQIDELRNLNVVDSGR